MQDACGVPLGVVVQPLAPTEDGSPPAPACWAADLARCTRCNAYINALCEVDDEGWACSLCGCGNDFSSAANLRRYYGAGKERRAALPELASPCLDALCPLAAADPEEGIDEVAALEAQPAVVALVDVCCGEEFLDLVKSSLTAAVDALPAAARFALVSFGSQVGLHPVRGGSTGSGGVQHLLLTDAEAASLALQEAAPLGRMLAPVGTCKASILAAIEALEAEPPVGGGTQRALGDTLRAVLRWVATGGAAAAAEGAQELQLTGANKAASTSDGSSPSGLPMAHGFPGMRLLLFLSGPPNCGAGAVVARRLAPAELAAVEAAQQQAAQQAVQELATLTLDPQARRLSIQHLQYPELSAWNESLVRSAEARRQLAAEAAAAARAAAGDLSHAPPPGVTAEQLEVNVVAREFYAEAGAAAAALGASVDVFAACPHWMGLDLIEPLATTSGGSIALYRSLEAAAMTQDVYKSVAQPRALACMLRLRCSPELELRGAHGRLVPDREQPDLFGLPCCSPDDAFTFDLDRSAQRATCTTPAVQLVLQYSVLLPAPPVGEGAAPDGNRFVLHRRMRVLTAALPLAPSPPHLFGSCNPDALACLVVHKSLVTAAEQGVQEARQMLFDWLALLTAAVAELHGGAGAPKADASLADTQTLHHMPHLVFALLQGPLLRTPGATSPQRRLPTLWQHPDAPATLRALLRTLAPDELSVAVCPQLSSWASPEQPAAPQHSLSSAALAVSQQPLWVLDAYSQLIVLSTAAAAPAADDAAILPPPAASLLRRTLAGIRAGRRCTPELCMLQQGRDDTSPFTEWLLEDAAALPEGKVATQQAEIDTQQKQQQQRDWPSFVAFLDAVTCEAQRLLQGGR